MKDIFEQYKKMMPKDLLVQKQELEIERHKEIMKLTASGKKSSSKVKQLKKKVAWVETIISEKVKTQIEDN